MMKMCEHFVLIGATPYLGAEYIQQEFDLDFRTKPDSYAFDAELVRLLQRLFQVRRACRVRSSRGC